MIRFVVPVETPNPLNGSQGLTRGAMIAKSRRRKKQRSAAAFAALASGAGRLHLLHKATLTRHSSGTLDGDGLQAALKSVRDGIADALKVNDGSNSFAWAYEQSKCKRGVSFVVVEIE